MYPERGRKSAGMRSRTQLSVLAALKATTTMPIRGARMGVRAYRRRSHAQPAPPRRVVEEALGGRVRIHRGRVLPRRPLVEADLATGAPVQRATPGGWAGLNGLPATRTRLALRPYTAGPSATPGTVMCSLRSRLARSSLAAPLTRRTASISGSPHRGERASRPAQSTSQRYTLPTPQNTLVQQHRGEGCPRVVVGEQQLDAATEVGVGATEVRPDPTEAGMAAGVGHAERLHERSVEAHRLPPGDLDEHAHLVVRAHPRVAAAVEVPRTAHPQVRVQHHGVVPHDLDMLAVALDRLDRAPGRGVTPISLGASKRTILRSTSAVRNAAAARWMESASAIAPRR